MGTGSGKRTHRRLPQNGMETYVEHMLSWPTCACQTLARPLLGQCARALHLPSVVTTNHTQSEYTVSSDIDYSGCSRNRLQTYIYMCFRADVTRYCVGHAYIAHILAAMDTRVDMYLISKIASTIGSCISGIHRQGAKVSVKNPAYWARFSA